MSELAGGSLRDQIESAPADDRYLMLFTRATVQRAGKSLAIAFAMGCDIDADGKWKEVWFGTDDTAALEAFWAAVATEPVGA